MTVNDIRLMKKDMLSVKECCTAMKMSEDKFRYYARTKQLPFPVQESGRALKISRIGFLNWVDGKKPEPETSLADVARELRTIGIFLGEMLKEKSLYRYTEAMKKIQEVCKDGLPDNQNNGRAQVQDEAV